MKKRAYAPINGHVFGQSTVQIAGDALTLPKARFVDAYHAQPRLRDLINRYQSVLLAQAQQNAACHALPSVRSRLCRWMLQSQDMIGSPTFSLTQEFLSHMLGVRRNTVSVEAHTLQQAGLIRYARGKRKALPCINGDEVVDKVRAGAAEIGSTFISEIVPATGVTLVGPLPAAIGNATAYAAGIMAASANREAAARFIAMLTAPSRRDVWTLLGFEPAGRAGVR